MNLQSILSRMIFFLTAASLVVGVLGCSPEQAGPRAWIDFPTDGSTLAVNSPVTVISHVYAPDGIAEVVLSVNGQAYRRDPPAQSGGSFSKSSHEWFPQQTGDHTLQVRVYSKNGTIADSQAVLVKAIGKATPTLVLPAITPRIPTPVVTPVPGLPDLAIVSVEAVAVGDKDGIPFCNTRVTYRNGGTAAVPRDFAIQFNFNGIPTLTNIVVGLAPGGTSQITFVYQFQGSPYIGITLDSTSLIAESDETNNAFAEIRLCGGTPPPTTPPTRTPTIGIPPIISITPTRSPTIPPPPPGCSGNPNISSFSASPSSIQPGQSSTLSWGAVTNADSVSIDPGVGGVGTPGSRSVSPQTTTTYVLTARCGNNSATRQAVVNVATPVPPQDKTPPPAPHLVSPSGAQSCRSNVTLDWDAVSDPSGIKTYYVKLERQITQGNWQSAGGWTTSSTSQNVSVQCGGIYRWQARAEDNAGNQSGWSGAMNFSINLD